MKITISPSSAYGITSAPPSKSISHRLLVCAGLAEGVSTILGVAYSDDVMATIDCLRAIGADVRISGDTVTVRGCDPVHRTEEVYLPCRECGSTMRFFIPICLLSEQNARIGGKPRLMQRPLDILENICADSGLTFSRGSENILLGGPLKAGEFSVDGGVSSQFISGLMFALPLLPSDSIIHVTGKFESRPYIDMTADTLADFGVSVEWLDERTLRIPGGQHYRPCRMTVEGDWSNAAFFDALTLLGGEVTITGLRDDSRQGDRIYRQYFDALREGCPTLSVQDSPDLAPILMACSACFHGCTLTDTARLHIKESDRGKVLAEELEKFGIHSDVYDNKVVVHPGTLRAPTVPIDGHGDHRIVMATAILLTKVGGTIDGAEAVTKSMPDFFARLEGLGIKITREL